MQTTYSVQHHDQYGLLSGNKTQLPEEAIHRYPLSSALIQVLLHYALQRAKSHTVVFSKSHHTFCYALVQAHSLVIEA